jgi:hypothetical protein
MLVNAAVFYPHSSCPLLMGYLLGKKRKMAVLILDQIRGRQ